MSSYMAYRKDDGIAFIGAHKIKFIICDSLSIVWFGVFNIAIQILWFAYMPVWR